MNTDLEDVPLSGNRRTLLVGGALLAGTAAAGVGYVATHSSQPIAMDVFSDLARAMRTLEHLRETPLHTRSGWDLAHVLHHCAQSVEYSLDGFPQLKPAWFRASLGAMAFAVFSARGKMSHGLEEPIPGAPTIASSQPLDAAVEHLMGALNRFERHGAALAPHFAYGALSKSEYTRAHLMHLANHWELMDAG
ncbi:DUF1569 domain-containing protein [Variovorax sp. Root411]|uniref:DUF1569 domain-containing protein n=1 Tax=Variovorax sp. Root411 TaxID=1736530 RepID=UPI0006F83098|nr:DUF1569 domain-containing protein [Variovorax sp. Root411]KQW55400.1 hypothetical protein ASC92_19450 [Variovorax sp. Root411]